MSTEEEPTDQITKIQENPAASKTKNPKKVAAGKKLAEYHKRAKIALEKEETDPPSNESWNFDFETIGTIIGFGLTGIGLYFQWKQMNPKIQESKPEPEPKVVRRNLME